MQLDIRKARDAVKMYNSRNTNVNTAVWAHNCAEQLPDAIDLIEQQVAKITTLEAELAEMHKCALEVAGFLAEKKNLEDTRELRKSDESVFQEAIDCMNTAETGYGYIIANEEKFSAAIQRLEYLKKIVENKRSEKQWQITEERKTALRDAVGTLTDRSMGDWETIDIINVMLTEAGQE